MKIHETVTTIPIFIIPFLFRQIRTVVRASTADNTKFGMTNLSQLLELESAVKQLPPTLDHSKHKGQSGRVGIIGGSIEYAGAPYFAGITALRCGADIVIIFCSKDAAGPIKSYAPELIVLPFLDDEQSFDLIVPRLTNLHSLVIGPGLGENARVHSLIRSLINHIKENERIRSSMSLVFDADGIGFLANHKEILRDYLAPVYLTPNVNELKKLTSAYLGIPNLIEDNHDYAAYLKTLVCNINENTTMIVKGQHDKIITSREVYNCCVDGSARRIGGQGDLLSGSLGLFSYWALLRRGTKVNNVDIPAEILAAYSACVVTRSCNKLAYLQKGRSMITSDMINEVGNAFNACFN